jgi:hypothetical protein
MSVSTSRLTLMSMCLDALARELGGAKLLFTNTANAELSGYEPFHV